MVGQFLVDIGWCLFFFSSQYKWCFQSTVLQAWLMKSVAKGEWNQSSLREISPEYSLEGRVLKLKLQYSGHLKQRTDSLGNTLMLGKIEGRRRRGQQRMRWLDGITNSMDMSLSKLRERPGVLQSMWSQMLDTTEQMNNKIHDDWYSDKIYEP